MDPLGPLTETLRKLNARLEAVEGKVGITAGAGAGAGAAPPAPPAKKKSKSKKSAPPKPDPVTTLTPAGTWKVVNYSRSDPVKLSEGIENNHRVAIRNCEFMNVHVTSKCTSVSLENCKKVNVMVHSVIASVEVMNSKGCKVQVQTLAPTVTLDNVQGFTIFFSYQNRGASIVSSNISDCNVSFPDGEGDEAEWLELPIPEQFVTKINNDNTTSTEVSEIYG